MKQTNVKTLTKIRGDLENMNATIEMLQSEEQDAHDSKSEKWQESEKGEASTQNLEWLQEALDSMQGAVDALQNIIDQHNE